MAIPLNVNGQVFEYPVTFDESWGIDATGWAQAVTNGMLQRQGGNFPLTADANFGTSFGLVAKYYKSESANIASAGIVRLAKADTIDWRNNANSADNVLAINSFDQLTYNSVVIGAATGVTTITGTANEIIASSSTGNITLSTPQAIGTASSVTFGQITDSGLTASELVTTNGSSQLTSLASPTLTEIAYVGGVTSSIQTQFNNVQTQITNTNALIPPTGTILMYGAASAPSGWLKCDGTSYTTAGQPALFAIIGYTFGGGGANFNVPNLTNNVPVGAGSLAALGATAGAQTHVISSTELPTHNHTASSTVTDPGHRHNFAAYGVAGGTTTEICLPNNANTGSSLNSYTSGTTGVANTTTGVTVATTTSNAGSSSAMSLVQPSLGITFIIKT